MADNDLLGPTDPADLKRRVAFTRLGEEDTDALKAFGPILEEKIDDLLEEFYGFITQVPELKALFRDADHISFARNAQRVHWLERVFSGRFDENYVASVTAIGSAHARIDLNPRWYIGAYCFVLNKLHRIVDEIFGDDVAARQATSGAINKAIFLDMDFAISIYIEEAKNLAKKLLSEQAERFELTVKQVVSSVSNAATELEATAGVVAAAAEESVSQSATVSTATTQCQSAIQKIKEQVTSSGDITREAVSLAKAAETSIDSLNSSTDTISAFSKTISDIAAQTNLLALNATIEAARAGEAGKGFAVVASEVKALAQQTAKATEEIGSQLDAIQKEVRSTSGVINNVATTINRIDEMTVDISSAMNEQEVAMDDVAANVVGIREASAETGQATSETLAATSELAHQSTILEERVNTFLQEVREAG